MNWFRSAKSSLFVGFMLTAGIGLAIKTAGTSTTAPLTDRLDSSRAEFGHLLGRPAPHFELIGLNGKTLSPQNETAALDKPQLLVFVNTDCTACDKVYPYLDKFAEHLAVAVVGTGDEAALREKLPAAAQPIQVAFDPDHAIQELYRIYRTPSLVLVDITGKIIYAGRDPEQAISDLRLKI